MKMTSDKEGKTESGKFLPPRTEVEYLGHLGWAAVRVRLADGSVEIMHPHCFECLR